MTKELLPGLLAVEDIPQNIGNMKHVVGQIIGLGYSILGIGTADKISEQEIKKVFGQEWTEGSLKVFLNLNNLNPSTTVLLTTKK